MRLYVLMFLLACFVFLIVQNWMPVFHLARTRVRQTIFVDEVAHTLSTTLSTLGTLVEEGEAETSPKEMYLRTMDETTPPDAGGCDGNTAFTFYEGGIVEDNQATTKISAKQGAVASAAGGGNLTKTLSKLGNLRYLLLSGHAAPQNDMASFLNILMKVPASQITYVCFRQYCENMVKIKYGVNAKEPVDATGFKLWFWLKGMGQFSGHTASQYFEDENIKEVLLEFEAYVAAFDVVIIDYPSGLANLILQINELLRPTVVIRLSHRWNVWLDGTRHNQWGTQLHKLGKLSGVVIAANNPYDYLHFRHSVGVWSLPWPSLYIHVKGGVPGGKWSYARVSPDLQHTALLLGNENTDYAHNELYPDLLRAARSSTDAWKIHTLKDLRRRLNTTETVKGYSRYELADLLAYPLVIALPYAMHSAKLNELYQLNVPIVLPSLEFQTEYSVQTMGEAFKHAFIPGLVPAYKGEGSFTLCSPQDDINTKDAEDQRFRDTQSTKRWLSFADFNMWPHISRFDSVEQAAEVVSSLLYDSTALELRSQEMGIWFQQVQENTANIVSHRLEKEIEYNQQRRHAMHLILVQEAMKNITMVP